MSSMQSTSKAGSSNRNDRAYHRDFPGYLCLCGLHRGGAGKAISVCCPVINGERTASSAFLREGYLKQLCTIDVARAVEKRDVFSLI